MTKFDGDGDARCKHCRLTFDRHAVGGHCPDPEDTVCNRQMGRAYCEKPKGHEGPHEFAEDFI
jgi:hypothetical protein